MVRCGTKRGSEDVFDPCLEFLTGAGRKRFESVTELLGRLAWVDDRCELHRVTRWPYCFGSHPGRRASCRCRPSWAGLDDFAFEFFAVELVLGVEDDHRVALPSRSISIAMSGAARSWRFVAAVPLRWYVLWGMSFTLVPDGRSVRRGVAAAPQDVEVEAARISAKDLFLNSQPRSAATFANALITCSVPRVSYSEGRFSSGYQAPAPPALGEVPGSGGASALRGE